MEYAIAFEKAIDAPEFVDNIDDMYEHKRFLFQKDNQAKVKKCIERIENNYRKAQYDEDVEWNRCNDKIIEIIEEEMGVENE